MEQIDTHITSILGVGAVYGAVIVSKIADISRFEKGEKILSYAELDATVNESGECKGTQSHMSKRGSPYPRKAIFGAALVASWNDSELSKYYDPLRERGKHHLVAVGAVARKLCYYIHAVLSENRPFEKRGEPTNWSIDKIHSAFLLPCGGLFALSFFFSFSMCFLFNFFQNTY